VPPVVLPMVQVRQRALLELGDALLDDGVGAVFPFHVQERFVPVGEHGVVPPDRDGQGLLVQRLPGGCLPKAADPAHDQPGGHRGLGAGERGVGRLGDLSAARDDDPVVVLDRVPVGDRLPGIVTDHRDHPGHGGIVAGGHAEPTVARRQQAMNRLS